MASDDGYANEMNNPTNEPNRSDHTAEAAVSYAAVAGLADAFGEPGDRVIAENMASRAVALQASLAQGTAHHGFLGGLVLRLGRGLGKLRALLAGPRLRTGVGAIAAVTLMGGLAAADALPSPIQDPVADVAAMVGIDFPDSDEVDAIRTETNEADDDPDGTGNDVDPEVDKPSTETGEGPDLDDDDDDDDSADRRDDSDHDGSDQDDSDDEDNEDNSGKGNGSNEEEDDDSEDEDSDDEDSDEDDSDSDDD